MERRQVSIWKILSLIFIGLFFPKYTLLAPLFVIGSIIAFPFALLFDVDMPWGWGDFFLALIFGTVYWGAWAWRTPAFDRAPSWLKDLIGRALGGVEVETVSIDKYRGNDEIATRRDALASSNEAVEQLMNDLLSRQPSGQGWLVEVASSLRDQARAGRLHGNLERIVGILEQERKRMEHLAEINKLTGQLRHGDLAADVEAKRMALERLKLEQEAQKLAAEMDELLGIKVKERQLKEKEIELRMAQIERDMEELRGKPEPAAQPQSEEPPEQYATRRADLLIKYAGEIKRIRESVDDPELANDLADQFIVDIQRREGR